MKVNFFAKPIDGLINKSTLGGILTLLSFVISFFLLLSELYQFALIDTHEHLQIRKIPDTKESVAIKLHITFPYLHCNDLQVDYVNTKSDEKLDRRQRPVVKRKITSKESQLLKSANFLPASDAASSAALGPVGCSIEGVLNTVVVGGNFKISLTQNVWGAVALQGMQSVEKLMNVSHYVHDVSVGKYFNKKVNPLKNLPVGIPEGIGLVQFYLKVIPTIYKRPMSMTKTQYQISMTEQFVKMSTLLISGNMQQPGVMFSYDFTPMEIEHRESRENILTFLGSLFSVVGGIFVSLGLVSNCLMKAVGASKKLD
ncbi:hypothetical protein TrVE_jg4621 [Triparma verrucosa]|uniref:Uncharacterized protein n=2 Tax=Triparma TaxID=722752 RepID=A0A9W7A600_9STRA|nr:hypothetical protein TrST_g7703 [Triparma strigata]GMH98025.1 hypothetical protein TrVE_jg4621 [Triparma verrucosa]